MVSKTRDKLPRQTSRIKMRAEWVESADYLAELRKFVMPQQEKDGQFPYSRNKEQMAQQQSTGTVSDNASRFTRFHDKRISLTSNLGGGLLPQKENFNPLWHRVDFPFVFAVLVGLVGAIVMQLML